MEWFSAHWFDLAQTAGIIASVLIAAKTVRTEEHARRVSNSIAITRQYQEIQKTLICHPILRRVYDRQADIQKQPVSGEEEAFVKMIIAQSSTVYRAKQHGEFVELEGLEKDVQFFALPIPEVVWNKFKTLQDSSFVAFVATCVDSNSSLK